MSIQILAVVIGGIAFIDLLFLNLISSGKGIIFILFTQLITAAIGTYVVRKVGFNLLFFIDAELKKETVIVRELWDEFYFLLGGCLLFLPGFLTDLAGTLLLIKDVRVVLLDILEK